MIRGERTQGYQALRCPHCGAGVFVLPRSPLPLPPAPATARSKPRPAAASRASGFDDVGIELTDAPPQEDLDEIQWVDPEADDTASAQGSDEPEIDFSEEVAAEMVAAPAAPPKPRRPRHAARPHSSARAADPEAEADPEPEAHPGMIAVPARPRRGGRVALALVAVALMAVGTWYYRAWRSRLQELPHVAEVNANEGKAALERGQFDEAKLKLARAASAYEELRVGDEAAIEAIQLSKEAAILADASRSSLAEIIEEVARMGDPDGLERFKISHQGQAILVDSEVKTPGSAGSPTELWYMVLVGRGPTPARVGRLDLSGFELLKGGDFKRGDHLIFGARLGSLRIEDGEWRIKLEPGSGTWMTNAKALAAGFQEVPPS